MKQVDIKRVLIVVFGIVLILIGGLFVYQAFVVSSRSANQQNRQEIMKQHNMLDQSDMPNSPDYGFPSEMESVNSEDALFDTNQMLESLDQDNEDPTADLQSIEQELQQL